jgi:hypothetical protein
MADPISPPSSGNFQKYHVLSLDEYDDFDDGGNVVLSSPSSELGGLVTNASMHSTGGPPSPDHLRSRSPTKSFEEIRSVATSSSAQSSVGSGSGRHHIGLQPSHSSGGTGGGIKSRGNSSSLPNSPLQSLTKSASLGESEDEGEEDDVDDAGHGAAADEGRLDGGGGGKLTWDDDDLSDGDDEAGLRRYSHFARVGAMPAEFDSGRHLNASAWKRMTSYLLELRMAARQRRAHRLLSMSGTHMDSPAQQCRLCFMMYCWDATDRSILLLIMSVFAWMVLGFVLRPGKKWWYWGLAVLFIRLAARPLLEALGSSLHRGQPFRSSSSTSASVPRAMPSPAGFGRVSSATVGSAESLEMGSSSHHRSLGRQARSRSPIPKAMMV